MHLALSCNTVLSYAKWGGLEKKHEKQMSWQQAVQQNIEVGETLSEEILPVCPSHGVPALLDTGKVHEVGGTVHLVVELLRVGQRQLVSNTNKET
jgi:hypothetical protein